VEVIWENVKFMNLNGESDDRETSSESDDSDEEYSI
jgi:hypothetical protein